jgi:hypothetical protein
MPVALAGFAAPSFDFGSRFAIAAQRSRKRKRAGRTGPFLTETKDYS